MKGFITYQNQNRRFKTIYKITNPIIQKNPEGKNINKKIIHLLQIFLKIQETEKILNLLMLNCIKML